MESACEADDWQNILRVFDKYQQNNREYVHIPLQQIDKKILILKLEASTDKAHIYINF